MSDPDTKQTTDERIGGYAPGNYQCTCLTCGEAFVGDKRAISCERCARNQTTERDPGFYWVVWLGCGGKAAREAEVMLWKDEGPDWRGWFHAGSERPYEPDDLVPVSGRLEPPAGYVQEPVL